MARKRVNIGSMVSEHVKDLHMICVNVKTQTSYGSKVIKEKNKIFMFKNENEYRAYMKETKRKTVKMANSNGEITKKTIRYMPRYEVVGLGSYDPQIEFFKFEKREDGSWSITYAEKQNRMIDMSCNNIY